MRALLVLLAACAIAPPPRAPSDPANPQAPSGRLAGAPASLRPGVVTYPDVPATRAAPPMHHHHP